MVSCKSFNPAAGIAVLLALAVANLVSAQGDVASGVGYKIGKLCDFNETMGRCVLGTNYYLDQMEIPTDNAADKLLLETFRWLTTCWVIGEAGPCRAAGASGCSWNSTNQFCNYTGTAGFDNDLERRCQRGSDEIKCKASIIAADIRRNCGNIGTDPITCTQAKACTWKTYRYGRGCDAEYFSLPFALALAQTMGSKLASEWDTQDKKCEALTTKDACLSFDRQASEEVRSNDPSLTTSTVPNGNAAGRPYASATGVVTTLLLLAASALAL